ncbi:UNVERIFIED_CONTAM: Ggact [Trichonephila clavipes]
MKLSVFCASLCGKYRFVSCRWKCKQFVSRASQNLAVVQHLNHPFAVALSTSISCALFHSSATLCAKRFQERENEHAHNIMSNINSYARSVVKNPVTLKNGPLNSYSSEVSSVRELNRFAESTEGDSPYQYLVFVYGTLKRNEPNYDLVADPSKGKALFEGMARTVQKYPLVIASRYNIPYLLYREGVGKNVIGELYKIDEAMLAVMDELECNGKYYLRIQIEVQPFGPEGDKGSPVKPWIYFLMNFREHLLDLPHLEDYSSKGPHGLEYVSRYNRPGGEDYYKEVQNLPETSESIWNKPIERFQKLEISSKCQSHAEAVEYLLVFD